MYVVYERSTLPVLRACDALIVGGSMAGVSAAMELARAGRRVVVVEQRTYLGRDITATLRPWLVQGDYPFSGLLCRLIAAAGITLDGESDIALRMDHLKLFLEDELIGAGVGLLYASYPVQVLQDNGAVRGVVIANKSSRQVVTAPLLIDATPTALLARLAGAAFEPPLQATRSFRRTLEYAAALSPHRAIPVPAHFGVDGNSLPVHRGHQGAHHKYLEATFSFAAADDLDSLMQREIDARRRSIALAFYLQENTAEFHHSLLAASSHELHGQQTTPLAGPTPTWAADMANQRVTVPRCQAGLVLPAPCFAGPPPGLWMLQEAARLPDEQAGLFLNPVASAHIGEGLAACLASNWAAACAETPRPLTRQSASAARAVAAGLTIREQESPQRGRSYPQQAVPPQEVPVVRASQTLVVGGGTSGAVAAVTSAREGARTVLLDMNPGLGGTGTLGGVPEYWMGRKEGFVRSIQKSVQETDSRLGFMPPSRWLQWSVEGRMHVFLRDAIAANVDVFFHTMAIGVIMEGDAVRGVVAATPYGPQAFLAGVTVDATGDGDIAAWAGADFVYGAARDHTVMWYSLPWIGGPGQPLGGNFTSMCDVSNIEDYTRAILAGRRRRPGIHDHGVYLAPRESRHILGDVVLSANDQFLHRRWPDVVNIFYSNYDIKGRSTTDWNLAGLISANLEIEFPYRALLPRHLDGILVTGKAFSAGSDATPSIRMQADLENLGGVAGMAAAMAVHGDCSPRQIAVAKLQQKLVDVGVLPPAILARQLTKRSLSASGLLAWVERLAAATPLYELNNTLDSIVLRDRIPFVEVCTAGPRALPVLRQALNTAKGERQVLLAQALAMCGDAAGVPVLISRIDEMLGEGDLPQRTAFILNTVPHLPDHAAMPAVTYLIYSLGMTRDRRSLPIWQKIVDRLHVTDEDVRHSFKSTYYYVDAVCYGAERLGDPAAIAMLDQLHSQPLLHERVLRQGCEADYMLERLAGLELVIARALARCGSAGGIGVLVDYLDDVRTLLAEHAHSELTSITGQDFGKDGNAWQAWLAANKQILAPKPWPGDTDAVKAWTQDILVD